MIIVWRKPEKVKNTKAVVLRSTGELASGDAKSSLAGK